MSCEETNHSQVIHWQLNLRDITWRPLATQTSDYPASGVFTTFSSRNGGLDDGLWSKHIDRLMSGLALWGISLPTTLIPKSLPELLAGYPLPLECPVVMRILVPWVTPDAWIVSCRPLPSKPVSLKLKTVRFHRLYPTVKHTMRARDNTFLQAVQAQGADDFLRVTQGGLVSETAYANLIWTPDGERLCSPDPVTSGCLPGTTVAHLSQAFPIQYGRYTLADVFAAQRVWCVNAVRGVRAVSTIDTHSWDLEKPCPVQAQLTSSLS